MRVPRLGWLAWIVPARHREEWLGDLVERWSRERSGGRSPMVACLRLYHRVVWSGIVGRGHGAAGTVRDGAGPVGGLTRDVRSALRTLPRKPGASGAALATIALGVWAFTTAYALLDRALLGDLGYEAEERLVLVGMGESALYGVSFPDHLELAVRNPAVEMAAAWQGWSLLHRSDDGPWARLAAASVSAAFFAMLGAEAPLGRLFGPADDLPGHAPAVVLSWETWQTRFGGARSVVGTTLDADGEAYRIVGVAPRGFRDPVTRLYGWSEPEVWRVSPPAFDPAVNGRGQVSFWSLARVREGVPLDDLAAGVTAAAAAAYGSAEAAEDIDARSFEDLVGRGSRRSILLLLGAAGVVLLVALANVANLLIARGTGRTREMAVRASMGASRLRLVRLLLVEGAVLGAAGGAVGCGLAALSLRPLESLSAGLLPPGTDLMLDRRILSVSMLTAMLVGALAALVPALSTTRGRHLVSLREGRGSGDRRTLVQSGLVVAQTTLAVALVAASGLLLRSLWSLGAQETGFSVEGVSTVRLGLLPELFGGETEQTATAEAVAERLAAAPGVAAVGGITDLPMSGAVNSTPVRRTDVGEGAPGAQVTTLVRAVLPGLRSALDLPLLAGRFIEAADRPGSLEVAVVNRSYASQAFGTDDPLGRVVLVRGVERTIVGVVDDVREFTLEESGNAVLYEPYAQTRPPWMRASLTLVVRSEAALTEGMVRAATDQVDPRIPLTTFRPMQTYVDRALLAHRFRAVLATAFGLLTLVLAAVGLAGLTAYNVGLRTRELGLRAALGASPKRLARSVGMGAGGLAVPGLLLGTGLAVVLGRGLSAFLFGVAAVDPPTLAAAVVALAVVAALATAGPVRRAMRIDPVDALRDDAH